MIAKVYSGALVGIDAVPVTVEVDIARGLPQVLIVGLPDASVSESRERVKAAIKSSGYEVPLGRLVVNMAPADLRKEGSHFDLPIAIGILVSSGQLTLSDDLWLVGELSLSGKLRPGGGILSIAWAARKSGVSGIVVPAANAQEAALVEGLNVYGAEDLADVVAIIGDADRRSQALTSAEPFHPLSEDAPDYRDLRYVKGQYQAKRALEIAAAGGHNLLLIGEPGGGKSMLAQCMPGIMPSLSKDLAIEITKIYSVAGLLLDGAQTIITSRPFRCPHHSISGAGLIGGGSNPRPGEISLAHGGVLFLDELAEFDKKTLDNLRQPIESGRVVITRARMTVEYPAGFCLIAACNPYTGIKRPGTDRLIISAPLWDRFAMVVWVPSLKADELLSFDPGSQESSGEVRNRVEQAWNVQFARHESRNNAKLTPAELRTYCALDSASEKMLRSAIQTLSLTGRTYDHVLRTARTIADLEGASNIGEEHIAEAVQYRLSQEDVLSMSRS